MDLTMDEYLLKYIGRADLNVVRVWDAEKKELTYSNIFDLSAKHKDKIITYPVGKVDVTGKPIYQGDIVKVNIHIKYGDVERVAAVRTDGFYCCGLDYFNADGKITEEGDYIDEFFIEGMEIVGNVFLGREEAGT
ncbi:MAG: hypothetical protein Q8M92_01875 [Candidatus Subteraquimicrobiales bacterium]|nr:hypothetical protein [Candidatus Subteraquimicrobiales bacterium]